MSTKKDEVLVGDVADQEQGKGKGDMTKLRSMFDTLVASAGVEIASASGEARDKAALLRDIIDVAQQMKNLEEGRAWPTRSPDYTVKLVPDSELVRTLEDVLTRLKALDPSTSASPTG